MRTKNICIFGASGFVGRALTERLMQRKDIEIRPIVHSTGNAWSLLRLGIPIFQADQSDIISVNKAIKGCTHVVNCSLGPFETMVPNLKNLIDSCKEQHIVRLIHISSVTVYGERPHSKSEHENGLGRARKKSYGWYKNKQDKIIKKANEDGLSSVVLCPPHVTGAYGRIFLQVLEGIRNGTFALVENGKYPCNLVDINNLCYAIELSLNIDLSDGERIFITNGDNFTWKDFAYGLAKLAETVPESIPNITKEQAEFLENKRLSLGNFIKKVIKLPEVKQAAGQTILFQNLILYKITSNILRATKILNKKDLISDDNSREPVLDLSKLDPWLCTQQLRGVRHLNTKAEKILGYKPSIDSKESLEVFKDYFNKLYGFDTAYWSLSKELMD